MRTLLFIVALLFCFPAAASIHGSSTSNTCPKGTGWGDGCSGAPPDGAVKFPAFFTASSNGYVQDGIARQSGQTYATRPPNNVAGVDFPVSYSQAALTKDPLKIGLDVPGCTYETNGSAAGEPMVECYSSSNPDIEGYDFSPTGPRGVCVPVRFHNNSSGTFTFRNNRFKSDANCAQQGYLVQIDNGTSGDVVFDKNYGDGNALVLASSGVFADGFNFYNGGRVTLSYSGFLHFTGRPVNTKTNSDILAQDDYVEGFIYGANTEHGEFIANTPPSGNQTSITYVNVTILQPANVHDATGGGTNGAIWMSNGIISPPNTINSFSVKYSTLIVNLAGGPGGTRVAGGNIAYNYNAIGTANISTSYFDGTGSGDCIEASGVTGQAGWLSGNVALQSGNPVNAWNTSC